jgi:hypothetical protein
VGLQFHPESILTQYGYQMLANFLQLACIPLPDQVPSIDDELRIETRPEPTLPQSPVTF